MAQDPTRVIPGDYSATAYDVLSKYDPAFPENVSVEDFFENLQSPEYAAKAYSLLADSDPELVENLSLDEFIDNVKKKTSPSLRNLFRTLVHRRYYPRLRSRKGDYFQKLTSLEIKSMSLA